MKKLLYALPFILGVFCFLGASLSPSTVLTSGLLYEPYFFLIPIGYIFIFIGVLIVGIGGCITLYKKKKS
ncbi:DUF3955 domain-containing protein [Clostridium sp. B9]|uniref:DUF3955 domain-containing protein n=1 Tax=Clostridium sp. B9 TaxID=3423224 RepID=UPI003D2EFDCB